MPVRYCGDGTSFSRWEPAICSIEYRMRLRPGCPRQVEPCIDLPPCPSGCDDCCEVFEGDFRHDDYAASCPCIRCGDISRDRCRAIRMAAFAGASGHCGLAWSGARCGGQSSGRDGNYYSERSSGSRPARIPPGQCLHSDADFVRTQKRKYRRSRRRISRRRLSHLGH